MANWCVSGGNSSYRVNSSAAASGRLNIRINARILGNITGGVYHIKQIGPENETHIATIEGYQWEKPFITNLQSLPSPIMNKNGHSQDMAGTHVDSSGGLSRRPTVRRTHRAA